MHLISRLTAAAALIGASAIAIAQTIPADKTAEQPALNLSAGGARLDVFDHIYIVEPIDPGTNLQNAGFRAAVSAWPFDAVAYAEFGGLAGPVWARLRITNTDDQAGQWRLDAPPGWGVLTYAHVVRQDGPPELILANNWFDQGFDERYPRTLRPASAPFELAPGETVDLWFDLPYGLTGHEIFWLYDEDAFEQARLADASFETAVFGFRLALAAAIFAFAAVLRSRLALYYGLFSTFLTVFFLNTSGYIYAYVVKSTALDGLIYTVSGLGIIVVFTLMIQENIKARKTYPRYNALLLAALGLGIATAVATNWLEMPALVYNLLRSASLALYVGVALYGGYIGVRDRHPGGRQFLLASVVLFAIVMIGLASWPPFYLIEIEDINVLQLVGFTVDALLFASALVSRAIELRRARDTAAAAELKAVTERARIAEQLAQARGDHEDALDLAETRRRQLAATSHDLAQPLVSLQMSLKKMQGAEAVAEGIEFLESVVRRNLDDSRPDTVQQPARTNGASAFALDQTLRNVVLMFAEEAGDKGVDLRSVATSAQVLCEPVALMRIAVNLVANAIQHSAGGRVLIGARRAGATVRLLVADNGAGMTPEQADKIFAPYVSGPDSRGEGLGLSVIKTLAESQGFTISVRSKPGAGSRFTIAGIRCAPDSGSG